MTPLARVASGFLLVVFDLRIQGVDLLPDLVGWLLALSGLVALAHRSGWFGVAGAGAVVGAVLAVPQLVSEPGPVLEAVAWIPETALVFATCSGIRAASDQASVARTADLIRWLDLGLLVVLLATSFAARFDPFSGLVAIPFVIVTVVVAIWFLVFLVKVRGLPTLQARQRVGG